MIQLIKEEENWIDADSLTKEAEYYIELISEINQIYPQNVLPLLIE